MSSSGGPDVPKLEDEIRRMILGNVVSGDRANQHNNPHGRRLVANDSRNTQSSQYSSIGTNQLHGLNTRENWSQPRHDGVSHPRLHADRLQGGSTNTHWRAGPGPGSFSHKSRGIIPQHAMQHEQQRAVTSPRGSAQHGPLTPMDPDAYSRHQRPAPQQVWQPTPRQTVHGRGPRPQSDPRVEHLNALVQRLMPLIEMNAAELEEKERFRETLQGLVRQTCIDCQYTDDPEQVTLESFGSLSSGFATQNADMDLAIADHKQADGRLAMDPGDCGLFERIQKKLLEHEIGARLLSRTRVPILKICEKPGDTLLEALRMDCEQQEKSQEDGVIQTISAKTESESADAQQHEPQSLPLQSGGRATDLSQARDEPIGEVAQSVESELILESALDPGTAPKELKSPPPKGGHVSGRRWTRDKAKGPLDFPNHGVGVQCDINFSNPLGQHNTRLLRCYNRCDPRVRPMVLFVKAWASKRKINSSYAGTLSSYGYVLMVLHYLVNIARPPVLPNLQLEAEGHGLPAKIVDGWKIQYWDDESTIVERARAGLLTRNDETVGGLIKGFFQYYAFQDRNNFGFWWAQHALSLRTPGGIVTKHEKNWVGAKIEVTEEREIKNRYLFAIEDPFELRHNVARTVTSPGIIAIRDEFRRAWRILGTLLHNQPSHDGGIMDDLVEAGKPDHKGSEVDDATMVTKEDTRSVGQA